MISSVKFAHNKVEEDIIQESVSSVNTGKRKSQSAFGFTDNNLLETMQKKMETFKEEYRKMEDMMDQLEDSIFHFQEYIAANEPQHIDVSMEM